jgi:hypothetical protein
MPDLALACYILYATPANFRVLRVAANIFSMMPATYTLFFLCGADIYYNSIIIPAIQRLRPVF